MNQSRRIVITGLGTINPLGNNVTDYFENLEKGVSGAGLITHFDASLFRTKIACEVKNFDPTLYLEHKDVRKYDRYGLFTMAAAIQAVEDAAISDDVNRERCGVIWGSGIGGVQTFHDESVGWVEGNRIPRYSPYFIPRMISDVVGGMVSVRYGFMGPNYTVTSACSSSNHAIIDAMNTIRMGNADLIVTGGAEAPICIPSVGGFSSMMALSSRNDDPEHASRPFDKNRDGFVLAEGAGALVIEELEHALKRGARIYCELLGGGMSADAYHMTAPHPEGKGAILSMENALRDAGISHTQVDYLNAHGTSTPLGDLAELKAVCKLFGEHVYKMNISSTKSMTGHLLGGTAAIEALACVMAIMKGIVPPTINVEQLDDKIDPRLNLTLSKAQYRTVDIAMSNTFGFGGHNSTIILGKFKS
ncbi:MAG: beta-ketoacyl-ACP synthase II [Alistipes sp.]|nr:beta-ketoacyl-ACP synthase II [Candidatus Alistipes equi]